MGSKFPPSVQSYYYVRSKFDTQLEARNLELASVSRPGK